MHVFCKDCLDKSMVSSTVLQAGAVAVGVGRWAAVPAVGGSADHAADHAVCGVRTVGGLAAVPAVCGVLTMIITILCRTTKVDAD